MLCVNGQWAMAAKSSLVQSIKTGDVKSLEKLLRIHTFVDLFVDDHLNTPLHLSIASNSNVIVDLLLQAGASINAKNKNGDTALHKAAGGTNVRLVELLLEKGASMNILNKDGFTPFHIAVSKGYKNIVNAMLDRRADVHMKTANGDSPLHLAARHCNCILTESLLDRGALVNTFNNEGQFPLHITVMNNCLITTLVLLHQGKPYLDIVDKEGWTPLHLAVKERNRALVKLLISHGALTNIQNCWGHTALHTAVRNVDLTMVDILLSKSAVLPDVRDIFGHTPIHYALTSNYPSLVFRLLLGGGTISKDVLNRTSFDQCPSVQNELTAYIIKLKIVGGAYPGCEFEGVWYELYSKLSASCFEEIEMLRKTHISNYSLYDVFSKKVDLCTLHDAFKATVNSAAFQTNFPNYSFIIRSKLLKAKKKLLHYKHAAIFFRFIHIIRSLPLIPSSIVDRILVHISYVDLQNLIACLENSMEHKIMHPKSQWWFL